MIMNMIQSQSVKMLYIADYICSMIGKPFVILTHTVCCPRYVNLSSSATYSNEKFARNDIIKK